MRTINHSKKAFTLVEIMIVVVIIGLLAAMAIPAFNKVRETSQGKTCVNNMRQIDSAIDEWALEAGMKTGDAIVEGDEDTGIFAYIKGNEMPTCPVGSTVYVPTVVGTATPCANHDEDGNPI